MVTCHDIVFLAQTLRQLMKNTKKVPLKETDETNVPTILNITPRVERKTHVASHICEIRKQIRQGFFYSTLEIYNV